MESQGNKSYDIKYTVKCKLQNFFDKETVVKNCMSEMHAKVKLNDYCAKKYGVEFTCIVITSCKEKRTYEDLIDSFGDIFGTGLMDRPSPNKSNYSDIVKEIFKNKKK